MSFFSHFPDVFVEESLTELKKTVWKCGCFLQRFSFYQSISSEQVDLNFGNKYSNNSLNILKTFSFQVPLDGTCNETLTCDPNTECRNNRCVCKSPWFTPCNATCGMHSIAASWTKKGISSFFCSRCSTSFLWRWTLRGGTELRSKHTLWSKQMRLPRSIHCTRRTLLFVFRSIRQQLIFLIIELIFFR